METTKDFMDTNRSEFDFGVCSAGMGFAQFDTDSDASYFGIWANPETFTIINYCEGDVIKTVCENKKEFAGELNRIADWHNENNRFKGIDTMGNDSLIQKFVDAGVSHLLYPGILATMETETLKKRIKELSGSYDHEHRVSDKDVLKAKGLIRLIEATRDKETPVIGDAVICKGKGKHEKAVYNFGHLDRRPEEYTSVCTQPYVPFAFGNNGKLSLSTSGGYWLGRLNKDDFKYIGTRVKKFVTWGMCGACGNGAFTFEAKVNVWELYSDQIY